MQQKVKRIYLPKIRLALAGVAVFFLLLIAVKAIGKVYTAVSNTGLSLPTVINLMTDTGAPLASDKGRTNILILGIGGGTHDGSDLTDTMLVISIASETKKLSMISIPRDIWSDSMKDKANSAYHYGQLKKPGGGFTLAKAEVEDILGISIHYVVLLDFTGFQKIVDLLGGIDVDISKGFTDTEYPIAGKENDECGGDPKYACRYETVTFKKGLEHMDGKRALIYVRSRHAEGDEGSDFARSIRQQEVLVAVKKKISNPWEYIRNGKAKPMLDAIMAAIETDMNIGQLLTVGKLASRIDSGSTTKISIEDLFYVPASSDYEGKYVLIPADGFDAIHAYIGKQLSQMQ